MEPEINLSTTVKSNFNTPIAIVVAGLIIAGAIYYSDNNKNDGSITDTTKPQAQTTAQVVDVKKVNTDGNPYIGNPNAPVTIAYWFDYQCPACKYSEENVMTPLVEKYVKTGKVRVVFKDFQFLSADSQTLGITARAVWEAYPDKFYEWHNAIFTNQGEERSGWATKAVINELTSRVLGINQKVIDDLVAKNSVKYQKAIDADKAEGGRFGVNSTPSFIIGTELVVGAPRYFDQFSTYYIESKLK